MAGFNFNPGIADGLNQRLCKVNHLKKYQPQTMEENPQEITLSALADEMIKRATLNTKEVLTTEEAAQYMGISMSHLYKLTSTGQIPCYRPTGKMVYINRQELEQWLQTNRASSAEEINDKANNYLMKGGIK